MYRDVGDVLARVQETVPFLGIELVDIDQRSMFDDTPLILVMSWEDVPAATLLLQSGADVTARGERGDTALHRAASFGNAELVGLLLANDAPTSAKNDDGHTALDLAKVLGNEAVVALLDGKS
jgi:ankyrin repeat protein